MPGITINSKLDTKPVISSLSEINRHIQSLRATVTKAGRNMNASVVGYAKAMSTNAKVSSEVNAQVEELNATYHDLVEQVDRLANTKIDTKEYADLKKEIEGTEKQLRRLQETQQRLKDLGKDVVPTKEYTAVNKSIKASRKRLNGIEEEYDKQAVNAEAASNNAINIRSRISNEEKAIKDFQAKLSDAEKQANAFMKSAYGIADGERKIGVMMSRVDANYSNLIANAQEQIADSQQELENVQWTDPAAAQEIKEEIERYKEKIKVYQEARAAKIAELQAEDTRAKSTDDYKRYQEYTEYANTYKQSLDDARTRLEAYKNELPQAESEENKYVEIMTSLEEQLDAAQSEYDKLIEQRKELEATGGNLTDTEAMRRNQYDIQKTTELLQKLQQQKEAMESSGTATVMGDTTKEYGDVVSKAADAEKKLHETIENAQEDTKPIHIKEWEQMNTVTGAVANSFAKLQNVAAMAGYAIQHPLEALNRIVPVVASGIANLAGRVLNLAASFGKMAINNIVSTLRNMASSAINAAAGLARMAGSTVVSFLRRLADGAKKAAVQLGKVAGSAIIGGLRKIGSLAAMAGKSLLGLGKSARKSNGGIKDAIKLLVRYGFGVRSVFMLVRKLRAAVVDAFQNMAKKVPEVNKTLSALSSSMDLLKNSLATAFQPILTAIAPYLVQLMDMMSEAAAKVGEFFAVLTGQNYIYQATKANIDYAKSLDKSTKSTKKNTKETENQLASFDHLNILKDTKKDKTDKEKTPTADFKKVPIESAISDLAKRIKDAFSKGDFTEIGKILANKLTEWVNEINWAWLGKKIGEGINHIVDVVNGFFDNFDWVDLGQKFAEGLNSLIDNVNFYELGRAMTQKLRALIETAWGVVSDINWEHVGDAIGNYIQGAFDNIPWETLGETVGTAITGVFRALQNAIVSFGWADAGERLANALNSMFDSINWVQIGNTINALFKGVLKGLKTFIATFDWDSHAKELERGFKNFIKKLPTADIGEVLKNATIKILGFIRKGLINKDTWGQAGTKFGELLNKLFETDGKGNTIWTELALAVGDLAESVVTAISATVNEFEWGDAGQNFHDAVFLLVEKFPLDELGSGLSDLMAGALEFLNETLGDEKLFTQLGTDTADFFNRFTGNTALWDEIGEGVNNAFLGVLEFGQGFVDGFNETDAADAIKRALGKIHFDEIATNTWNLLKSAFAKAGSFVDALFSENLDNTRAQIDPAYVEKVVNFNNQSVGTRIGSKISEALSKIPWESIGETVWSAAKTAFSNAGDFLVAIFGITDEDIAATKSKSKIEAIGVKIGKELSKIPWKSIFETAKQEILTFFEGAISGLIGTESDSPGNGTVFAILAGAFILLKGGLVKAIAGLTGTVVGTVASNLPLVLDALLVFYDVKTIKDAADGYAEAGEAYNRMVETYANGYIQVLQSSGKEAADQYAAMVADIDTTSMSVDEAIMALTDKAKADWGDAPKDWREGLDQGWNTYFGENGRGLGALVEDAINGVLEAFGIKKPEVQGAAEDTFTIPLTLPDEVNADAETVANGGADSYINTLDGRKDEVSDKYDEVYLPSPEELKDMGYYEGQTIADNGVNGTVSELDSKKEEVKKAYEGTFVKTYEDGVEGSSGFDIGSGKSSRTGKLGIANVKNMSEGMDSEKHTLQKSLKGLVDESDTNWDNAKKGQAAKLEQMDKNLSKYMGQMSSTSSRETNEQERTISNKWGDMSSSQARNLEEMDRNMSRIMGAMTSTSDTETSNQAKPVYDNYGEIMVAVDECMRAARDYLVQYAGDMTDNLSGEMNAMGNLGWWVVGDAIIDGIADGINSGWNWLNNTVWNLAYSLFNSAKNALGIHSPSKVFREGIGENVGLGIAEGILDTKSDVMDSVASLADLASETMNETDFGDFVNADGTGLVDGLDSVLDVFANRVQNSFSDMLSKLNAIANTVTFRTPAIATGTVLPYAVSGGQTGGSKAISDVVAKTNDEQTSALIQAFNNQTVAIVRAIEQYSTTNVNIDNKSFTDAIIEEINRRTRAQGKSPLLI